MSRTRRAPLLVGTVGALLCAGFLLHAVAGPPPRLGRLFHELPGAPGELEPSGTAVASGDVVRSVGQPALLRLDNGHVLKLSANSSALIEGEASDDVQVTVLSGRVLAVGLSGRLQVAGKGSTFRRSPTLADTRAAESLLLQLEASEELARPEVDED